MNSTKERETKTYTSREVRSAVLLAILVTAVAILAVFNPSCGSTEPSGNRMGPMRADSPK